MTLPGHAHAQSQRGLLVILAFACDSKQGSEPGAGWLAVREASKIFDRMVVVTRHGDAPTLEQDVAELPADVRIVRITTRASRSMPIYVRYAEWTFRAARWLRRELDSPESAIDIVHHVTYASDWMMSPIAFLKNPVDRKLRVIWGPVGGSTYAPWSLVRRMPLNFQASEAIRWMVSHTFRAISLPMHRKRCNIAVALNADTAEALKGFDQVRVAANFAVDTNTLPTSRADRENVVVFAGRPIEWKGVRLALDSVSKSNGDWVLELMGGSREQFAPYGEVESARVRVMGRIPRTDLLRRLGDVRVLVLPSLHDSAPWIAAEAAAMGAIVICLDLGGVAAMAGQNARVVPALPAQTLVTRLAEAIDRAVADQGFRVAGPANVATAESYSTEMKLWYGVHA